MAAQPTAKSICSIDELVELLCSSKRPAAGDADDGGHPAAPEPLGTSPQRNLTKLREALSGVPLCELGHRGGQARYLLTNLVAAGCPQREVEIVRWSFLLQPEYFRRKVEVVYETPHFVFAHKPFDIQIGHGKGQSARYVGELTLEEVLHGLADASDLPTAMLKRCHNLDFATSGVSEGHPCACLHVRAVVPAQCAPLRGAHPHATHSTATPTHLHSPTMQH